MLGMPDQQSMPRTPEQARPSPAQISLRGRSQPIWINYQVPLHQYLSAYILHSETWKDLHRHVIFLSPDYGLLSAFLYGAVSKRNPLRATVQAFSFGQLNLKRGKRGRQALQIADWQLEAPGILLSNSHSGHCDALYRHVALWSELLLYSHGLDHHRAGRRGREKRDIRGDQCRKRAEQEPSLLFAELRSLLSSVLHFDSEAHCQLATLRFFWQFLLLEGFQPGLKCCHNCAQAFDLFGAAVFFSERSELLCARCAHRRNGQFLSANELNLLCWAEQDLSSFVRQDEFFFGSQAGLYCQVGTRMLLCLRQSLEHLLGRRLQAATVLAG